MKDSIPALLAQIMYYAAIVNEKTDYAIFVDFRGHVEQVEVRITRGKKNLQYNEWLVEGEVYFSETWEHNRIKRLKNMVRGLRDMAETGELPDNRIHEREHVVYTKHF